MRRDRIGFKYAFSGIATALKHEHNIRIHFIITFLTIFTGIWIGLSAIEWLFILIAIGLVLALELVNTVIETITDVLFTSTHETAKRIKDMSAAAVLIAATFASLVGIIIFLPKIMDLLF
ncbi:diacylglycerol kinase family protein [Halalkalibacillus halophilus]|uniref:diacylglycerol kinase family protein n=1 Tax=Halalkalibacillus halophilus TaxID=392827 RepID=UPI00048913F1|nr:diacylglycerol kinase family protein [Halalkalibacillus halophilus]